MNCGDIIVAVQIYENRVPYFESLRELDIRILVTVFAFLISLQFCFKVLILTKWINCSDSRVKKIDQWTDSKVKMDFVYSCTCSEAVWSIRDLLQISEHLTLWQIQMYVILNHLCSCFERRCFETVTLELHLATST